MEWHKLTESSQFKKLLDSEERFAIFKHSTRCSLSSMVKDRVERQWTGDFERIPIYYLDVLVFRGISNEVADTLNIRHESPQLIILEKGQVVYQASHTGIDLRSVLQR